uniref:Uncharacterized protein n=1 Tax=Meloidogyne enterolobii TaxID=390850 RepID=A0A6V7VGP2_MELEN|nr:unnamed protein product [Meloidogyne enterolobii]
MRKNDFNSLRRLHPYKFIKPQSGVFEFTLNDQLKKKWQVIIDNSIPLYISERELFLCIKSTVDGEPNNILYLPNIPKNIEEMIIIRCWLEHLFNCAFEYAHFDKCVFNPEIINILFDNDKTIPLKFNINHLYLSATKRICENMLDLILDNLVISGWFIIYFEDVDIPEQYTDILFNILINKGDKLNQVSFDSIKCELPRIYDLLVEYIATSKDCSKMVPEISLHFRPKTNIKVNERAEDVKVTEIRGAIKYMHYQISNIYNPKLRFYFSIAEPKDRSILCGLRMIRK